MLFLVHVVIHAQIIKNLLSSFPFPFSSSRATSNVDGTLFTLYGEQSGGFIPNSTTLYSILRTWTAVAFASADSRVCLLVLCLVFVRNSLSRNLLLVDTHPVHK